LYGTWLQVNKGELTTGSLFRVFSGGLKTYDEGFVSSLLAYVGGFTPSISFLSSVGEHTKLLDPARLEVLSLEMLLAQAENTKPGLDPHRHKNAGLVLPIAELKKVLIQLESIEHITPTSFDSIDEFFISVFPFRTKTDRNIRRCRFADVVAAMLKAGTTHDRITTILQHCLSFDYILTLNCLTAELLLNIDDHSWFDFFNTFGAFDGDLEHFVVVAKYITTTIKTKPCDVNLLLWVECAGFTGYRNLPYTEFDAINETKDLAEGGALPHQLSGLVDFDSACDEAINFPVEPWLSPCSFKEFVYSGAWTTSGSSSRGRVHVEIDGKLVSIKARKNLTMDVVSFETLYESALSSKKQVNTSIIKSELGKVRIAVASDIENYLLMSWMDKWINHGYRAIPGATIEEGVNTQLNRLLRTLELCSMFYGIPFDYTAFDHQITTKEIKKILSRVFFLARHTVPTQYCDEYDQIGQQILNSFDDASLTIKLNGVSSSFKITGGLNSGLRFTSLLGNLWNTVITHMVAVSLKKLIGKDLILERFIRGDDSAIFTKNYLDALLVRLGYQALSIKANDERFGILKGQMEFLRQWFTRERVYGYAARSLPGYVQRKPWNAYKWNPNDTLANQIDVIKIMKRRGANKENCNILIDTTLTIWSIKTRVDRRILSIPSELGGIGLLQAEERLIPSLPYPKTPKSLFKIINANDQRGQIITSSIKQRFPDVQIDDDRLKSLVSQQQNSILVGDDIPALNSYLRKVHKADVQTWKSKVRFEKLESHKPVPFPLNMTVDFTTELKNLPAVKDVFNTTLASYPTASFGSEPNLELLFQDLTTRKALEPGFNIMDYLLVHDSRVYYLIKSAQFKGMHRSAVISWLSGKYPYINDLQSNPILTPLISKLSAYLFLNLQEYNKNRYSFIYDAYQYSSFVDRCVAMSPLATRLTQW